MAVPTGGQRTEGRNARARVMEHPRDETMLRWYTELEAFVDRGWSHGLIAEVCSLSPRQVRRVLQDGRAALRKTRELPVEVEIAGELESCLEFSVEGFVAFFERFSGLPFPAHARAWVELFIGHPNVLINTPPRHAKTTILSIWLPVWLLCMDRNEQILIVSRAQRLSTYIARSIAIILESEVIVRSFGRFAPESIGEVRWAPSSGELMVMGRTKLGKPGDMSIGSFGMDQQILGFEATVIICDDITDAKIAVSAVLKAEEVRKLRDEILSRIQPEGTTNAAGRALMVGQRVHLEDLSGDIISGFWYGDEEEEASEFDFFVDTQRAVLDWETETVLWPEKRDFRYLQIQKRRMGTQSFETMFQQNPAPPGSAMIRPEWLEGCKDLDRPGGEGFRDQPASMIPVARVLSVDPSPTQWNAAVVADVAIQGKTNWTCAVVDARHWKGAGIEFRTNLEQLIGLYEPDYLIVEDVTVKWFVEDVWFQGLAKKIKVIKHTTGVNKNDLEVGVDTLAVDFENGRVRLPWGDPEGRAVSQVLIDEALRYPYSKVFDMIMALWFIKLNRRKLRPVFNLLSDTFAGTKIQPNAAGRAMQEERDRLKKRSRFDRIAS